MNNIKEIKSVTFVCENFESIKIPIENFTKLDVSKVGDCYSLSCIIEGIDNITEYTLYAEHLTPFQRIFEYNDITSMEIKYKNGNIDNLNMIWEGVNSNFYQESCLLRFNKIKIEINEEVKQTKIKRDIGKKADKILDILYQDIGINRCSDCPYYEDCKKMNQNKDVDICDVLLFLSKTYKNNQ